MNKNNKNEQELQKFKRDMENLSNLMTRYRWYVAGIIFLTVIITIIQLILK